MKQKGDEQDGYFDEEDVIGGSSSYHRPGCHVTRKIERKNYKKLTSRKSAVALGLRPCGLCKPFFVSSPKESGAPAQMTAGTAMSDSTSDAQKATATETPVSASQVSDWRRRIVQFLKRMDPDASRPEHERDGPAARIFRLSRAELIPRPIAAVMRTITEMRNATEYDSKTLSSTESALVAAAWVAIEEWVVSQGHTT